MKKLLFLIALLCTAVTSFAQKPQIKVDFVEPSKTDAIGLEPGYTAWRYPKDSYRDSLVVDGIKCVIYTNDGQYMRTGWNKEFVQNTTYSAKNSRLTGDGVAFDPDLCGTIILRFEGLPVGTHTVQTYFNSWADPATAYGYPMTVKYNGKVVHENVMRTFREPVAANATPISTDVTVSKEGEAVEIEFITSDDNPGTGDATHTKASKTPIINAFELNTASVIAQAKAPNPNSGDMHVDCDNKSYTLKWSPASADVVKHNLYIGLDSTTVANMTEPTAVLTDTCYQLNDIYSLNTYYWRVDEVDANGKACLGQIWNFQPRHLAFPGAEGYGRFARGGRGGYVYHVTNLDGGVDVPGSFGYGIRQSGAHTIVFDVSGIIDMAYRSVFSLKEITVAPETAPGKGICIQHSSLNFNSDCIVRHLRAKRGYGGSENTGNAIGVTGADHTILDHITAAWGTDETFSSRGAKNITFQYNIIAEALGIADHKNYDAGKNHGFAATIGGDYGTFSHNLLANCAGRNWSMGGGVDGDGNCAGELDMFNNVCYNWYSRTTDGGAKWMQFVNNYYKMGPDTKNEILFTPQNEGGGARTQFAYCAGNIRENKDGSLTQDAHEVTYNEQGPEPEKTYVTERFFDSYATIHSAQDAFKIVCSDAGATMPCRDNQHKRVVNETVTGTWTYKGSQSGIRGEIDREYDITGELDPDGNDTKGWEYWPEETRAANYDTDQDGMPDWYENLINSDPEDPNQNDDPDHDGYTLLEDYLDFMSHPYLILEPGSTQAYEMKDNFLGFTKSPSFTATANNTIASVSTEGSVATVKAGQAGGIGVITMQVTDSEGTSMTQQLSVAVTGETTAIKSITSDKYTVAKREIFTLDGKRINSLPTGEGRREADTYIIRETDTNGNVHTIKAIHK